MVSVPCDDVFRFFDIDRILQFTLITDAVKQSDVILDFLADICLAEIKQFFRCLFGACLEPDSGCVIIFSMRQFSRCHIGFSCAAEAFKNFCCMIVGRNV